MWKKFITLMLALLLVAGMIIPAVSAETEDADSDIIEETVSSEGFEDIQVPEESESDTEIQMLRADDEAVAFAIYSEDDCSLTFYSDEEVPEIGTGYGKDNKIVTATYIGFDSPNYNDRYTASSPAPWYDYASDVLAVYTDESFAKVNLYYLNYWFNNFLNCEIVDFTYINTGNVISMQGTFLECYALTEIIGIGDLDTHSVERLYSTFQNCESLTELPISDWDVSSCQSMDRTFYDCKSVESFNFPGWNTSNVTDMAYIFQNCESATTINVSDWNVEKVTDLTGAFRRCYKMTDIDLNGWVTSSATSMTNIFRQDRVLETLNIEYFDTSGVTEYDGFLLESPVLKEVTVGDDFDLFTKSETALTDIRNWYTETGSVLSDDYLIGISGAGTYYTYAEESPNRVTFSLGNGNGEYNFADYSGDAGNGDLLRYTTSNLDDYMDSDGTVTVHLPSEDNLDSMFVVVDGTGGLNDVRILFGHCSAYDFTLAGWVNIATKEYYDVTDGSVDAKLDMSISNTFYADYIGTDYDQGHSTDDNLRTDTVSTGDFVAIRMFDYTDLWNVYNAEAEQDGVDSEQWTATPYCVISDEQVCQSFTFNNDGTTAGSGHGLLQYLSGRGERNTWTGTPSDTAKSYFRDMTTDWGISKPGDTILGKLFDPEEDLMGVNYVGEADNLFWIDSNGYYTYDAEESAAVYNQTDARFYVYDSPQYMRRTSTNHQTGFFPYNSYTSDQDAYRAQDGSIDYFFGMEMQVDFFLPADAGNSSNKVNGKNMDFTFSGDDDIFIFIDDQIAVDMSGVHDRGYSDINFATGTVTIGMGLNSDGSVDTTYGSTHTLDLSAGRHTLTVYYMERGGWESNLAISFNLTSVWNYSSDFVDTVIVNKEWADGNENHQGDILRMGVFEHRDYDFCNDKKTVFTIGDKTYVYAEEVTYIGVDGEEYIYNPYWYEEGGSGIGWYDSSIDRFYVLTDVPLGDNPADISADCDWTYTWELLLQDRSDEYVVREMRYIPYYSPVYTLTQTENPDYKYWSIVGETELEDFYDGVGSSIDVLLTDAGQSGEDASHGLAIQYDLGVNNHIVFSRTPLTVMTNDVNETAFGENTYTMYGIVSDEQIREFKDLAWTLTYTSDYGEDSYGDALLHTFTISCPYGYLKENDDRTTLVLTDSAEDATEFYCDIEGEIRMYQDTQDRVIIEEDGLLLIVPTEDAVEYNNVRIYTLSEGHTDLFTYDIANIPEYYFGIRKTDETGNTMTGAEFTIADRDGNLLYFTPFNETTYVCADESINGAVSSIPAGNVLLGGMLEGTYIITESKAPVGYIELSESFIITIDENGIVLSNTNMPVTVLTEDSTVVFIIENSPEEELYDFSLFKADSEGDLLSGAAFIVESDGLYLIFEANGDGLYTLIDYAEDSSEATAVVSSAEGYVYFAGVPEGTYTITETKAPAGYVKLADPIVIMITGTGISIEETDSARQTGDWAFTVYNDLIEQLFEMPNAEGTGNALLWVAVGFTVITFGVAGTGYVLLRNHRSGKRLKK